MTASKIDLYKTYNTEYRCLKLQGEISVTRLCKIADSLFTENANMNNVILEKEEQQQRNIEMLQRGIEMEAKVNRT
jgi:hypothetical protein